MAEKDKIKRIHEGHNDANFDLLAKSLLLSGKNQVDALNSIADAVTNSGGGVDPAIITELEEAVDKLKEQVEGLEVYDDTELKNTLEALQTQIDSIEAYDDTELKNTLEALQTQIDSIEAYDDTGLKNTLEALQEQINSIKNSDISLMELAIVQISAALDIIEFWRDEADQTINNLIDCLSDLFFVQFERESSISISTSDDSGTISHTINGLDGYDGVALVGYNINGLTRSSNDVALIVQGVFWYPSNGKSATINWSNPFHGSFSGSVSFYVLYRKNLRE